MVVLPWRPARCDVSSLSLSVTQTARWSSYLDGRHVVMYRVSRCQWHKLLDGRLTLTAGTLWCIESLVVSDTNCSTTELSGSDIFHKTFNDDFHIYAGWNRWQLRDQKSYNYAVLNDNYRCLPLTPTSIHQPNKTTTTGPRWNVTQCTRQKDPSVHASFVCTFVEYHLFTGHSGSDWKHTT